MIPLTNIYSHIDLHSVLYRQIARSCICDLESSRIILLSIDNTDKNVVIQIYAIKFIRKYYYIILLNFFVLKREKLIVLMNLLFLFQSPVSASTFGRLVGYNVHYKSRDSPMQIR